MVYVDETLQSTRVAGLKERVSPPASSQDTKPGTHQRALLVMLVLLRNRSPVLTPTSTAREAIRLVRERRRVAA